MIQNPHLFLVEGQLEAYNQRDVEKFCKYYHPQIELYRLPEKEPFCLGLEQFKQIYAQKFKETPELHCHLVHRTIMATSIIDEELVSTSKEGPPSHALAIYHFKDQFIFRVWFAK